MQIEESGIIKSQGRAVILEDTSPYACYLSGIVEFTSSGSYENSQESPGWSAKTLVSGISFGFMSYSGYAFIRWGALALDVKSFVGFLLFAVGFWLASLIVELLIVPLTPKIFRDPSWIRTPGIH